MFAVVIFLAFAFSLPIVERLHDAYAASVKAAACRREMEWEAREKLAAEMLAR